MNINEIKGAKDFKNDIISLFEKAPFIKRWDKNHILSNIEKLWNKYLENQFLKEE